MLTKAEVQKNKIDLQYNKELQKLNALLILVSTGALSLFASVFVAPNYFSVILGASVLVIIAGLAYYYKVMRPRMETLVGSLTEIEKSLKR